MGHLKRRRPSPALIVALLALAVALGGTSWASSSQHAKRQAKHGDASQDRALVRSMAGGLSVRSAKIAGSAARAARASVADSAAPSGPAGGDLQGSYPNPRLKAPSVTQLALQTAAGIDCKAHPLTLCRIDVNNYWNQPSSGGLGYAGVMVDALGFVHLFGTVQRVGPNLQPFDFGLAFWLPASMRPSATLAFPAIDTTPIPVNGHNTFATLEVLVQPDGEVNIVGATSDGDRISLSGISFRP